jgi:cyanobactin maturation PatA/PatG family protease
LVPGAADGGPASKHGTHVASLIFGQPDTLITGVAPACSGIILPVFADGPQDSLVVCSQLDLARAIFQAVEHGAHVINISGGQLTPSGEPEPLLAKAVQACADNNVLIVAAAGNDGCECLHVPAAVDSVLTVGAMDERGEPLEISNWGQAYQTQGILAPGKNILGAVPSGKVAVKSGTSFSTPLVSGLAALLLSIQLKRGRKPNPYAVRAALLKSAVPCHSNGTVDCRRFLAGQVNAHGALCLILEGVKEMTDETLIEPSEIPNATKAQSAAVQTNVPDASSPLRVNLAVARAPDQPAVQASEATALDVSVGKAPVVPTNTQISSALTTLRSSPLAPKRITPSDCGCGGGTNCTCGAGKSATLVYALGKLNYDFGTEARRDTFTQAMPDNANPYDPAQMVDYLTANTFEAEALIWTLNLDATPIYAIMPAGPFASVSYERLREAFEGQLRRGVEIVSVPGVIAGAVTLLSGQVVPIIVPAVRGMFSWSTPALITSILGKRPQAKKDQELYDRRVGGLNNYLSRVYYDLRNLGITAGDRALNYSATNAFQLEQVMDSAARGDWELDTVNVKTSPVCRPDSDCYDVEISFFHPPNENVADRVYRFTVDVSDVMPVTIGDVRAWSKRH